MEIKKLQGAVEAILFASGEPVSAQRLSEALEVDRRTSDKLVADLADKFNQRCLGIRIVSLGDSWQMCTRPEFAEQVRTALDLRRNVPLSQAAMEALAVVAYNQPVTRAFVEQVRGVDCSGVMNSLSSKGLIEERGRLELPGRPLLYGTTPDFLRCLGISSVEELPAPEPQIEEAEPQEDAG